MECSTSGWEFLLSCYFWMEKRISSISRKFQLALMERNIAEMDGSSICFFVLRCLPNIWVWVCFLCGYCCFAKHQFCEADELFVRFCQFSGCWLLNRLLVVCFMSLLLGDNFSKSWAEFVPHTLSAFRRRSLFFPEKIVFTSRNVSLLLGAN